MFESSEDSQWWHVILATPIAIPIGGVIGGTIGALLIIAFGLAYPFALRRDAKFVSENSSTWNPSTGLYTLIGVLVFPLTFGILSYVVSPIYLYRRHKHIE